MGETQRGLRLSEERERRQETSDASTRASLANTPCEDFQKTWLSYHEEVSA
jgi:hypothetical protein